MIKSPGLMMFGHSSTFRVLRQVRHAPYEEFGEIVSDIRSQGERATQILNRHRTLLRSGQVEKRPTELHTVINESCALVARDLNQRHVETIVDLPPGPCVIHGDPVLLQQVFINLLMNARDSISETPRAANRITIKGEVRAAQVDVSVRDTGAGVHPEGGATFTVTLPRAR